MGKFYLTTSADSLINSVTWLYGAEVLPMSIRSKIMGVAAAAHYIVNVGGKYYVVVFDNSHINISWPVTQAGPTAFATIHENYYYVFVGCCCVYLVIIYFYYP